MDNSFQINKDSFKKKVEKTRYCRINAYKRCKEWQGFLLFLSFVYNLALVVLSILSISLLKENYLLSVIIAITSVIVFAISLFVAGLDYSKKANEYSHCYQELDSIIRAIELSKDDKELSVVREKYDLIMKFSPNHEECDYCRYKINYPEEQDSVEAKKEFEKLYRRHVVQSVAIKIVLTLVVFYPLYRFVIWIYSRNKNGKDRN